MSLQTAVRGTETPAPVQLRCPCCGTDLKSSRTLMVDLTTNSVVFGDKSITVGCAGSSSVIDLIHVLNKAWPEVVSFPEIGAALWGDDPPPQARAGIRVRISRARSLLDQLGIKIIMVYGRGYRLSLLSNKR
jgi:DNA-binding winged helix-turn-helix (wHTH) protein